MLRTSRAIASLLRSLSLGTAATIVGTATIATTFVVGCQDESQPDYWVDKLEEPKWRPRAIKRLEQFFEDAVTKAGGEVDSPEVQQLLEKTVKPLTDVYVNHYEDLDSKTRVTLIKLLASFRDKRTEPALKKAFEAFVKRPQSSRDEQDIKWAARAAADLQLPSLAGPMVAAFDKLRASTQLGGVTYRDFNEAMVAVADKSWVGPLSKKLEPEIVTPKSDKDRDLVDPFRDQLFWQTTAAEVLGLLGDPAAVDPLMRVMLDPAKANVHATALLAMVKLGKPAMDKAIALLKGEEKDLVSYHALRIKEHTGSDEAAKGDPHVQTGALILGTIGRPEAIDPMVEVMKNTESETTKAVIARELAKIPANQKSKEAFKEAYESISLDTVIPPGLNALEMLTESVGQFYDPGMIDWLLERAEETKGYGEAKKALQSSITVVVLKLAKADQLEQAKATVDKYGTQLEKDLYSQAEKLLKACGDRVSCYLTAIEKSEHQEKKTQFSGIKSAYMIGVLGDEKARDELITRLDAIDNAAVRYSAAQTIDYLSPKGSEEAAEQLKKIIEKNKKSADKNKIAADAPLKQVMYRIGARAG